MRYKEKSEWIESDWWLEKLGSSQIASLLSEWHPFTRTSQLEVGAPRRPRPSPANVRSLMVDFQSQQLMEHLTWRLKGDVRENESIIDGRRIARVRNGLALVPPPQPSLGITFTLFKDVKFLSFAGK